MMRGEEREVRRVEGDDERRREGGREGKRVRERKEGGGEKSERESLRKK